MPFSGPNCKFQSIFSSTIEIQSFGPFEYVLCHVGNGEGGSCGVKVVSVHFAIIMDKTALIMYHPLNVT